MLVSRQRPRWWKTGGAACAGIALLCPSAAIAHVKWFAPYDVPSQPHVLSQVLDVLFWQPMACAVVAMLIFCYAERGPIGRAVLRTLELISTGCARASMISIVPARRLFLSR